MRVVATAGHVDHGKSSLVRALTGTDPDRLAEEKRRGLTIELGFAWTPDRAVAFVDVPGHQRFLGTTLAGLGPASTVLLVVAADAGWSRQSEEHLRALEALGVQHGVLAVTRADLVDPGPATEQALTRLATTSLKGVEAVAVSAVTGDGLADLRAALDRLPVSPPDPAAPVRLWVDRVFSVTGAGTVVTGTLGAGALEVEDELLLRGQPVRVRRLQSLGVDVQRVVAPARVAVNLRGVARSDVGRGDALLDVPLAGTVLLVRTTEPVKGELVLHLGTAAVPVTPRTLGDGTVRFVLPIALPVRVGDRALLRDPAGQRLAAGAEVLAVDPTADPTVVVPPAAAVVEAWLRRHPLAAGMPVASLRGLDLTGLEVLGDRVRPPGWVPRVVPAVGALEERLARDPFDAPLPSELGLSAHELAAAVTAGRLLALTDAVVVLPSGPQSAVRVLQGLDQPFTTSQARQALGTTRRVAVALLEHLDATGVTVRDGAVRRVAD